MHDQFVVSIEDLRFVTMLCRHCNTRVTLDFSAEFDPGGNRKLAFAPPSECPRCSNRFDSAIPAAVDSMQKAYKALVGLGDAVTFTSDVAAAPAAAPAKP